MITKLIIIEILKILIIAIMIIMIVIIIIIIIIVINKILLTWCKIGNGKMQYAMCNIFNITNISSNVFLIGFFRLNYKIYKSTVNSFFSKWLPLVRWYLNGKSKNPSELQGH